MPVLWTSEKIAAKSDNEIETVRERAIKQNAQELVALCDAELVARSSRKKIKSVHGASKDRHNVPVVGYHFVCRPQEKGVVRNSDGTVWSGTWVVAEARAELSLKAGAYVALHLSHAEPSYLHGILKAWRRTKREKEYAEGREVRTPNGTDFLLQVTDQQVEWRGEGTVEKSYVYASDDVAGN